MRSGNEKLREARKQRLLSQQELAEKLNISRNTINRWERGDVRPSPENLRNLSDVLGVGLEELFPSSSVQLGVNLSPAGVAESIATAIDGIIQRRGRLGRFERDQLGTQNIDQEQQEQLLEIEGKLLQVERERIELLEKELELEKRRIEYALEIASKMIDILYPSSDENTRATIIQSLLSDILQLGNGKGLELALSTPAETKEEKK